MSGIRVLAGTRKGAFILTSDGKRKNWKVDGPHFAGWEIYHMKGSPVDPDRIYASQTSAWFGQIIQRSDDGGKSWNTPGGGPATNPQGNGNPVQAACVCTQFFWIKRIRDEYPSRSLLQAPSVVMTAARRGSQSTAVCIRNIFRIRWRKSAIAFIASRCIRRDRTRCLCKNIGT